MDFLLQIFAHWHLGYISDSSGSKILYGLFFPMAKKGTVFVVDTVRSDQMPNLNAMFNAERNVK